MAAQDYNGVVQQLYVSYFGRPADYYGLQNFTAQLNAIGAPTTFAGLQAAVGADRAGTTALSRLVNNFNSSAESTALYGTDNSQVGISKFVAAIYQNVLGREADIAGFNFWVSAITSGTLTKANAAAAITAAATANTSAQGLVDASTVAKKLAVATSFTTSLDTPTEFNAYAGDAAAATARGLLQGVNSSTDVAAYQANIDTAIGSIVNVAVPGQNFALTANIDNFIGTAGNDTFSATLSGVAGTNPIGSLDVIDGGAGRDTFSIADSGTASGASFALPTLTIRNVEVMNVATAGSLGTSGATFDISATGVATANLTAAGTLGSFVTAANTTDVTLTVGGTAGATLVGGRTAVVKAGDTAAVSVSGTALTGVTVTGGVAAINNTATSGNGTTLTSVTLNDVSGNNTITGNGVTTVNLAAIDTKGTTVAVTNTTTGGHTLNLNLNGVTAGSTAGEQIVVTDTTATRVAVTSTGSSNIALTAAAATAATVAGSAAVTLNLAGSAALTSLDASATTGNLTVTGAAAALTSIKGGSAVDRLTLNNAVKYTVDTGAGNDVVTLTAAVAAGTVINLGAGNDSLLVGTGGSIVASTTTATTIIDGGEGSDTIAASLINAGNAAQFRNFEALDMSAAANLDVQLITGSTIAGVTLFGGTGGATLSNVAANVGLTVAGNNTGVSTIGVVNASATDNSFNIGFSGAAATAAPNAANIDAGTIVLNGIETVNIASTGAANTWNAITLTDDALKTVTITGDKNLDLDFTGTNGATGSGNGLSLIDGSAATGKLMINLTTGGPTYNVAEAGLTVRGGSADDMITLGAGKATVVAGAGADMIVTGTGGGTLTGGAGNDTFNVQASVATGVTAATSVLTTITDFTAGDKINLGTGVAFGATKLALDSSVTNLEAAFTQAAAVTGAGATWFQYGTDTYIVADVGTANANTFGAGDLVVKLTGLIDLSTATSADGIVTL